MVSVDHFHGSHFIGQPFLPALDRDFRPYKPSPDALLHICREWRIPPQECLMVGDSAKDDVRLCRMLSNKEHLPDGHIDRTEKAMQLLSGLLCQ